MKKVFVSGCFDLLHSGHIAYLNAAARLGDQLFVGVNSDAWLERKKGRAFMPVEERSAIIGNLKPVSATLEFDDSDGSACALIEEVKKQYPYAEIIFANGGDRTKENIPEMRVDGVSFAFGVGGFDKANSSSWILQEWKTPKTERPWGYYRVLHDVPGTKVKELTINPGQSLSMQRHFKRNEFWHIAEGACEVDQAMPSGYTLPSVELLRHGQIVIPQNDWHRIRNPFDQPCKIIEVQYGTECIEEDIERK